MLAAALAVSTALVAGLATTPRVGVAGSTALGNAVPHVGASTVGAPRAMAAAHRAVPGIDAVDRAGVGSRPQTASLRWHNVTSYASHPGIFEFTEGTWDASDGYVLVYGGDNYSVNLDTTWAYSGGTWTEVSTSSVAGGVSGASLAYDANDSEVVMFGGVTSYTPQVWSNDTYTYHAGAWTAQLLDPTPPARIAANLVYDPALGGVVLFGGFNLSKNGTVLADTWLFSHGAWSQVATTGAPPGRWQSEMAYDPLLHEVVLYGGVSAAGVSLDDTWVLNGTTWRMVPGASQPGLLSDSQMAYDGDLGAVVLSCGLTGSNTFELGSWTFNGTAWVGLIVSGTPSGHDAGVGVWDPVDHVFLLAGGNPYGAWLEVLSTPLAAGAFSAPSEAGVGLPAAFHAVGVGGAPPHQYRWSWGDGNTSTGATANHRFALRGTYGVRCDISGADNESAVWFGNVTIVPNPTVNVTLSIGTTDTGVPVNFSASEVGAAGAVGVVWNFGDGTQGTGNSTSHAYTAPGNWTVVATVTDEIGNIGNATQVVFVNAAPTVEVGPSAPKGDVGRAIAFEASGSGGTAPYSYAWTVDGQSAGTGARVFETFSTPGPHSVNVTMTDAGGGVEWRQVTATVAPSMTVKIGGATSLAAGSTGAWSAETAGGTGPFQTNWTLPDGSSAVGAQSSYDFGNSGGTYKVSVKVTDAAGAVAAASVNVTVATSGGAGAFFSNPTNSIAVGAAVAGIVVAAGVLFALRARGRRTPPDPEPPAEPYESN